MELSPLALLHNLYLLALLHDLYLLALLHDLLCCPEQFGVSSSSVRNCSSRPSFIHKHHRGYPGCICCVHFHRFINRVCFRCWVHCTSHQSYGICLPSFNQQWIRLVTPELCVSLLSSPSSCFLFVVLSLPFLTYFTKF